MGVDIYAAGVPCNTIYGNGTSTAGGEPTDGAALRIADISRIYASRLEMRGNVGGYAVYAQPRDQDMPGIPNEFGVRDLGAYERQQGLQDCGAADTIFCNGFET